MRTIKRIPKARIRNLDHRSNEAGPSGHPTGQEQASHRKFNCIFFITLTALGLTAGVVGCSGNEEDTLPQKPSESNPPGISEKITHDHPHLSPNAKIETYELLLKDKNKLLAPGDGGGRMWLERLLVSNPAKPRQFSLAWQRGASKPAESESLRTDAQPPPLPASSLARFEMVFEVGPLGIDEGGVLFIEADPFWEWSSAQTQTPNRPGYVTATARRSGVKLEPDQRSGRFDIRGRALEAGERIDVVYGAGALGARVDRYAERGATILAGVDANGDGRRAWVKDLPSVDIAGGTGTQIVAFGPAEAAPGETFEIHISLLDKQGNPAEWSGRQTVTLERLPESSITPSKIAIATPAPKAIGGVQSTFSIAVTAPKMPGTLRLRAQSEGPKFSWSADVNPIVVREAAQRLRWADLHGHSKNSDGTGRAEDYFRYARDIARLDAVALTDHDHWGIRPLDLDPDNTARLLQVALGFHRPGAFVTLPGYEWTSWLHGHRHVLYFGEEAPILSSLDPATDRPDELWEALRDRKALTFSHHSAGEPIATNWSFRPDPEVETIAEITSVHGMSEAHDAPLPLLGAMAGVFVRDALMRGARLGFIGSGDSHDGHPGLAHLAAGPGRGGLAALFSKDLDRASLQSTLRARRSFATNGIRPWFMVDLEGAEMGEVIDAAAAGDPDQTLRIRFEATAPIERIDFIRTGAVASIPGGGTLSLDITRSIPPLRAGEFHYVRIIQRDRGVAWSSPIFAAAPLAALPNTDTTVPALPSESK